MNVIVFESTCVSDCQSQKTSDQWWWPNYAILLSNVESFEFLPCWWIDLVKAWITDPYFPFYAILWNNRILGRTFLAKHLTTIPTMVLNITKKEKDNHPYNFTFIVTRLLHIKLVWDQTNYDNNSLTLLHLSSRKIQVTTYIFLVVKQHSVIIN